MDTKRPKREAQRPRMEANGPRTESQRPKREAIVGKLRQYIEGAGKDYYLKTKET